MVGAVILARAIDDPALSDEVLEQTRAWIDTGISQVSASIAGRSALVESNAATGGSWAAILENIAP